MTGTAVAALALAAAGVLLAVATAATARRPGAPLPGLDVSFRRWQEQHRAPDVDPSADPFVRGALRLSLVLGRPAARAGLQPHALTGWALWGAAWVPVVASLGSRWALVAAAALAVASALADGVDGAVAGLTDRATPLGFVLDSVADRVADGLFLGALVAAGGSAPGAVAAGAGVALLEYTRARAGNAGLGEVGVVTVGERPTRVIATAFGLAGAAAVPSHAWGATTGALLVTAVSGAVGGAQLWAHLVRRWR